MLGAGVYPITIAEMLNYTSDADAHFEFEEHERVKTYLALHPESGDVLPETGGVRVLDWPLKSDVKVPKARIIYYFRDLNMPLYLLALYKPGERVPMDARSKEQIKFLVEELVAEHSQEWAAAARILRQVRGKDSETA